MFKLLRARSPCFILRRFCDVVSFARECEVSAVSICFVGPDFGGSGFDGAADRAGSTHSALRTAVARYLRCLTLTSKGMTKGDRKAKWTERGAEISGEPKETENDTEKTEEERDRQETTDRRHDNSAGKMK